MKPTPTPPGLTSPKNIDSSATPPPSGVKRVVHRVHRPVRRVRRRRRPEPDAAAPKRTSLPSRLPPPWSAEIDWSTPTAVERRVARRLGERGDRRSRSNRIAHHHRQEHAALPTIADHASVGDRERQRDQQDHHHLDQVRPPCRVLERVRRVDVEEAAAVRAELLDRRPATPPARPGSAASRPPAW